MASSRARRGVAAALACLLCRYFLGPASGFVSSSPLAGYHLVARQSGTDTGTFSVPASAALTSGDALATGAAALAGVALAVRIVAGRGPAGTRQLRTPCAGKKKKKGGRGGGGAPEEEQQGGGDEPEEEVDLEALLKEWKGKLQQPRDRLSENLVSLRAGKASPNMLDNLQVEAYGASCNIKEVGTVTTTDMTTLTVVCFDADVAPAVVKAVQMSDLGYSAVTTGAQVKIGIPEMTQEKRQQYVKLAKESTEKAKAAVRNVRQTVMKKVKNLKTLTKDESHALSQEVEGIVKGENTELESILKKKETELLKL